ncbi:RNA methyltransferase [Actinomadura sp. KC345]|uniref:TrmH family RNA methyltransferase n=1 Tax=Actinomadura sp. KC345 TaxID=2530371 RepID=UPI00104CDD07|nr:RNA methyltransferase [Actinomadura sp. KC345]TDC46224.1 RNA methyltransferase [Actinomadura sp. KC345]
MASLVPVTDPADPRLADFVRLRDVNLRKSLEAEHGLFVAEGEKVIRRAVGAGHPVRSLLMARRWAAPLADVLDGLDAPAYIADDATMESITGFQVHRGALASLERLPLPDVKAVLPAARHALVPEGPVDHATASGTTTRGESSQVSTVRRSRIAILENLVDHANVGACFRSAAALGVDAVLVTPSCADPLYRRSIKVSMGAVFQVPWTRIDDWPQGIDEMKAAGYVVAGLTLGRGAITLDRLVTEDHERLALVFGTEGHGITPKADRMLDRRVTIPMMHGVDSLNVAASSAVVFYASRVHRPERD